MWPIRRRYGPYAWSRTSQAFYDTLIQVVGREDRVLEFGSSTGHISFRLAREGYRVSLLDIRAEPINEARQLFAQAGVHAQFFVEDFLQHNGSYDVLWNSGLIQCLLAEQRQQVLRHAATLSRRLLLFYPDTDSSKKVCGADNSKIPGVGDAVEYSVADLPELFCRYYDNVYWGRLPADKLAVPFDMFWLQGDKTNG